MVSATPPPNSSLNTSSPDAPSSGTAEPVAAPLSRDARDEDYWFDGAIKTAKKVLAERRAKASPAQPSVKPPAAGRSRS